MTRRKFLLVFIGLLSLIAIAGCVSAPVQQLSPNASQSVLSVRRASSAEGKLQRMEFIVDGRTESNKIVNGGRGQVLVMNGLHNIQVRIGKHQSQMLTVDCESEVVEFLANFEGEQGLFLNTLQLNLTKLSGGERKTANAASNNTPVINIQVDNSSSNSSSSSGNSSSNSVVGNDNSVN